VAGGGWDGKVTAGGVDKITCVAILALGWSGGQLTKGGGPVGAD